MITIDNKKDFTNEIIKNWPLFLLTYLKFIFPQQCIYPFKKIGKIWQDLK